jgi:hypothetical protein
LPQTAVVFIKNNRDVSEVLICLDLLAELVVIHPGHIDVTDDQGGLVTI